MNFWGVPRVSAMDGEERDRLITRVVAASGEMPSVEMHRRYLATLPTRQLQERLGTLEKERGHLTPSPSPHQDAERVASERRARSDAPTW